MIPKVVKTVAEAFGIAFKYQTADLPASGTIVSAVASAKRLIDGVSFSAGGTAVIDNTTATVDQAGTRVSIGVQKGTDGEEYQVDLTSTLSAGEIFVDTFLLKIQDGPPC